MGIHGSCASDRRRWLVVLKMHGRAGDGGGRNCPLGWICTSGSWSGESPLVLVTLLLGVVACVLQVRWRGQPHWTGWSSITLQTSSSQHARSGVPGQHACTVGPVGTEVQDGDQGQTRVSSVEVGLGVGAGGPRQFYSARLYRCSKLSNMLCMVQRHYRWRPAVALCGPPLNPIVCGPAGQSVAATACERPAVALHT